MNPAMRLGIILAATSLLSAAPLAADEYQLDWSGTFELRLMDFQAPVDDDDKTGFFDQYEFARDKGGDPSVELGLSALDLDLLSNEGDTPKLQLRLRSPTSDLGISGGGLEAGEVFLNQRAALQARHRGIALDFDYRRLRTQELRLFHDEEFSSDPAEANDVFFVRRTRFGSELRVRPRELLRGEPGALAGFLSEVALRGGYGGRRGQRQLRSEPLRQFTRELDQTVADGGAGLVLHPGGLFTLAVDIDHQRFREDAPVSPLGGASADGFVPDTDRLTGTLRMNGRIGGRAALHAAFQISRLDQEGDRTPDQKAFGLRSNELLFYSGNVAADVDLLSGLSLNAFFKFDYRRNQIDRGTDLFDRDTESAPFLERLEKHAAGAELVARLPRMSRISLGLRGDWIDRELQYSTVPFQPPGAPILSEDSRSYAVYLATRLRPIRGLHLSGEIGYRESPETGYIRDLDDVVYGRLRSSYTLPLPRPVTLSFFGRWESGENNDFSITTENRGFERERSSYGGTLTGSPWDGMTLFGSVFTHDDAQDFDLRTRGPLVEEALDYRADTTTVTAGGSFQIGTRSDARFSYSLARSEWRFDPHNTTAETIEGLSRIHSDLHRAEFEVGHWLREGLRLSAGYRFDKYRDRTPPSTSPDAFSLSTRKHTILFAATLNSDLLR